MKFLQHVPALRNYIKNIPKEHLEPNDCTRTPLDFFKSALSERNPDKLLVGFVLGRLIKNEPTDMPGNIDEKLADVFEYYNEFMEDEQYTQGFIRQQLKMEFPNDYQETGLLIKINEIVRSRAYVESEPDRGALVAEIPLRYLPETPRVHCQYTAVSWDLFDNWYGVDHIHEVFNAKMTDRQRKTFSQRAQLAVLRVE
ncbi:hypothetical protein GOV12_03495 [Candidatus Pacearchaeota archaeon]|nr:hypothetical protein [Candidatus Pacearchaeota archaeon]